MSNQEEIQQLITRYTDGTASPAERQRLENWYETIQGPQAPFSSETAKAVLQQQLLQGIYRQRPALKPRSNIQYMPWVAAASLLLITAIGFYFYRNHPAAEAIQPGYNQATLTLADGTKIALDSAQSGIIVNDQDIKYSNGNLVQNVILSGERGKEQGGAEGSLPTSLTLTTPKGGQYQIILSDGTKVWLNAASTLKYPSRFSDNSREVFLEGEAYFEVNNKAAGARVPRVPFIVKSKNQEITVLGTSFNLSAYSTETKEKTTLVEGRIQVKSENVALKTYNLQLLRPEQQAVVKGDSLMVSKVDVNNETAWRNNKFSFDGKPFEQIMAELARWYNLDVQYEGPIPQARFFGGAYRNKNLSIVLGVLESGRINYELQGHTLIIHNQEKGGRKN